MLSQKSFPQITQINADIFVFCENQRNQRDNYRESANENNRIIDCEI